jgi:FG-GAP-like repeat
MKNKLNGLLAASVLLTLAACGGGGDSPTDSTPETVANTPDNPPAVVAPVELLAVAASPVPFARYDVKAGMSYSYGFATADFDGDGRPDISFFDSYAGGRGELRAEEGAIGYMQWSGGPLERTVAADNFPEAVAPDVKEALFERHVAADINGDGLPDIVGVVNSHAAVVAYINPGTRGAPWTRQYISLVTQAPINIATGDIDGDGLSDLVVSMRNLPANAADPNARGLVWLKNPGPDGTDWVQRAIENTSDLIEPRTLQIADFDGDGKPDVAVNDASTQGTVAWLRRGDDGVWTRQNIAGALAIHAHFGAVADLDGDGHMDIIQPVYQGITWLRNVDGGTTWEARPLVTFKVEATQIIVSEVAVGDIDGDGKTDIAFVITSLASLPTSARRGGAYWLQQGASLDLGQWTTHKIEFEENSTVGVALIDYDVDGDLDIVTNSEYQRNAITLWRNDTVRP